MPHGFAKAEATEATLSSLLAELQSQSEPNLELLRDLKTEIEEMRMVVCEATNEKFNTVN